MPFGFAGKGLEVDLTNGTVKKNYIKPEHFIQFLGGRGVATKMFVERVSPDTDPFSPDNPLVFSAGLLTGTIAPSANRTALVTKSPQTGLLTYSTIGGFWGPELKQAGYDTLFISGVSENPAYLFIQNDLVELRDALHLWGKNVRETQQILTKELKQNKIQILCIGPAGENKVFASSIEHTMGAGAHRAGVGAVMGHKKLKAIAVYGTKDTQVANPTELKKTCEYILSKTDRIREYWNNWPAKNGSWLFSEAMHGNYEEEVILEEAEKALIDFESAYKTRSAGCLNCGVGCKSIISLPEGEYACIKCQSFFNFMFAIKIYDIHFSVRCFKLCENYGLDVISTAYLTGFAIDLYQKGIITQADTGGLELKWQDRETAFRMIEKIVNREDIGDILAYGVVEASKKIGKGAEEHAYHIKKLEPIPYTIDPYSTLLSSVGDKPDQTRSEGFIPSEGLEYYSTEWRRKYVKDGYFSYPEELKPDFEMDEEKAMNAAKRTGIMTRAYNAMTGISRKNDTIHQRFFEKPREYYH